MKPNTASLATPRRRTYGTIHNKTIISQSLDDLMNIATLRDAIEEDGGRLPTMSTVYGLALAVCAKDSEGFARRYRKYVG